MTLKVVSIGAGWVTTSRHLPALKRDKRVEVIGIVDRHADRAQAAAEKFKLPHWGTSLEEDWTATAQCLTIGTPPLAHAELVGTALERGWHCLCEKPFALPSSRARDLVDQAEASELTLAVVHNFQYSRSGARLFELVDQGALGTIEAVYAFQLSNPRRRLPHWYPDLPGGLFLDEAPHLLYLLRRVLGGRLDLRGVDARLDGTQIRDVLATFEHESIWATLAMSFGASVSEWQFVVVGDRSVAALDVFRDILLVLPNDSSHRAREILRTSAHAAGGHLSGVFSSGIRLAGRRLDYGNDQVVGRFVDAVSGVPGRLAWISGEDGRAVVEGLEAILVQAGIEPASA
jgi:scyllo-inositol 2-dehydrogenase (NADP+)